MISGDSVQQWLANRGYEVLSVNYRGSTGYGKAFVTAADHEWGGRMHDDLIDAVSWAIVQGIADRKRVGFFGGSYGGYSALMAATKTPEVFACIVDHFGNQTDVAGKPTSGSVCWPVGAGPQRESNSAVGVDRR